MIQVSAVFRTAPALTPEVAAKIVDLASQYNASMLLEYQGKRLQADSLISVLAMNLYEGVQVGIVADGAQAQEAAEAMKALLESA